MKKQLSNAIGKKVFTLLAASVIALSAQQALALPEPATKVINAAEVTFKGVENNYLVFKLNYNNKAEQPFELQIKNEDGKVLYSKKHSAAPLNTDIYFAEVPEDCKLTFSIVSGKDEASQTFTVNSSFKTVREYDVKGN